MLEKIETFVILVTVAIKNGDKYLLGLRSATDDQAAGTWGFIGGKVESSKGIDIISETIEKEVMEECGVTVKTESIKYLVSDFFTRSSGHKVVSLNFVCDYKSGEPQALEDQDEVKWFTIEELEELLDNDSRIYYLMPIVKALNNLHSL